MSVNGNELKRPANTARLSPTEWVEFYAIIRRVFDRNFAYFCPDPSKQAEFLLFLVDHSSSLREYSLALGEDLDNTWKALRDRQLAVDLLYATAGDIFMESGLTVPRVAGALAAGVYEILPGGTAKHEVTDPRFIESLGLETDLVELLRSNAWLMTLALLRRAGALNVTAWTSGT